jgi:hypothetical protein
VSRPREECQPCGDESCTDCYVQDDEDLEPAPFLAGDISDTDLEYDAWKDDRHDPDRYR